jgi:hypothetical protein
MGKDTLQHLTINKDFSTCRQGMEVKFGNKAKRPFQDRTLRFE